MAREIRRNAKGEKLYPFSMRKEGHNIELAYNHMYCIVHDMYHGDREWNQKTVDFYEKLTEIYGKAMGCPIYWATGKEYGFLREVSAWAVCHRDEANAGV